ncbi:hypothetical protein I79_016167 [Cricetulus griseus]|uniref:Uncharacterized protein n=1 Tax=Cricetulus griseus TaxID=10029 RepID=G3HYM6_CRIGR|nr:hypothetical protein I79_016167 [Cricetulus griseus]
MIPQNNYDCILQFSHFRYRAPALAVTLRPGIWVPHSAAGAAQGRTKRQWNQQAGERQSSSNVPVAIVRQCQAGPGPAPTAVLALPPPPDRVRAQRQAARVSEAGGSRPAPQRPPRI